MSILVKGMKMPTECRECRFMDYHYTGETWCLHTNRILAMDFKPIPYEGRPRWCPLIELPSKHGRLIDADALMDIFADRLEKMSEWYGNPSVAGAVSGAMKLLDVQPTVIESEGEG